MGRGGGGLGVGGGGGRGGGEVGGGGGGGGVRRFGKDIWPISSLVCVARAKRKIAKLVSVLSYSHTVVFSYIYVTLCQPICCNVSCPHCTSAHIKSMGVNEKAKFAKALSSVRWEPLFLLHTCEEKYNYYKDVCDFTNG